MKPWDKKAWGVELHSTGSPTLIANTWGDCDTFARNTEPTRALLFATREAARQWCTSRHKFYEKYGEGHICTEWRFRPVRVRETVKKL